MGCVSLVSAQAAALVIVYSDSCLMRGGGYGQYVIQGAVVASEASYLVVVATFYQEGKVIATGYSAPIVALSGATYPFGIVTDVPACNAVTSYTLTTSSG